MEDCTRSVKVTVGGTGCARRGGVVGYSICCRIAQPSDADAVHDWADSDDSQHVK